MHLRAIAVATGVAAGLLAAAPAAFAAGPPIMALGDVQPGMRCTASSVVLGTAVATFDARIDEVLRGAAADATRLLVTLSGPAVDGTGIGPGFSGSPITCTGADGVPRIAGAISEGIGEFGGRRALATPIEAVLGEPVDPPATARVARRLLRRARPLAQPLTVSGLAPAIGSAFAAAARRSGRTLVAAPAAARSAQAAPALVPGSAIAVSAATGDLGSGAIGTAAYVDGDRIWAFGHELDGAGRRSLTLSSAYVFTVVSNPLATGEAETYKLAAPLADVGTVTQDGANGVAGRLGPLPRRFPLRVVGLDLDRGRSRALNVQVADERDAGLPAGGSGLALLLAEGASQAAYTALQGLPSRMSGRVCLRATVKQRRAPLAFCNTYVGVGGGAEAFAGSPVIDDLGSAAKLLDAYDAGPLDVTGVTVGMRLTRAHRLGTLVRAQAPAVVRRGATVPVRLTLRRTGGGSFTRTVQVRVPRGMPAGPRDILLVGTPADGPAPGDGADLTLGDLVESGAPASDGAPRTVRELASAVAALHRDDALGARFVPPGAMAPGRLPGGAEGIAQRRRPVFRSDELRIDGRARAHVVVR